MKKISMIFILLTTLLIQSGCTQLPNEAVNKAKVEQKTADKEKQQTAVLLKRFKAAFPDAVIVGQKIADVDNDKVKDLVIIFNNTIDNSVEVTKSNLCVIMSQEMNALDLAGGNLNFKFAKGRDSLKILQNPTRISVILHDSKSGKDVDFQVITTVNKKKNFVNFKIITKP